MKSQLLILTLFVLTLTATVFAAENETHIGGYGEIAYNGYSTDNSRNQFDIKRFVITMEHRFDDKLSMNGEVEWEHAVTSADDEGESEIEQAYLNYQFDKTINMKAGLFLMPFGLLNESHEPPVFYGVERNEVETRIIPSTWREGGLALYGETEAGISWNAGLVTGFDVAKFDNPASPLSSIHQEGQLAKAHDPSYYIALNYTLPGFTIGSSFFTGNSAQGNSDFRRNTTLPDFEGINAPITLGDVHTRFQAAGWDLQAVYAKGTIGDADRIDQVIAAYNIANPGTPRELVASEFYGWLAQVAYTFDLNSKTTLSPFARYEDFDTQSSMPDTFVANPNNKDTVTTVGFSLHPNEKVVFKADYQSFKVVDANNRLNLGMGYMF